MTDRFGDDGTHRPSNCESLYMHPTRGPLIEAAKTADRFDILDGKRRAEAPRLLWLQPSGLCSLPCAGAVVSGAPPTETGPAGFDDRAHFLWVITDSRLRARTFGMEEVISGAMAFCSESTFAISVESCEDILLISIRSSLRLCLSTTSVVEFC